jgi:hypothetical protein
LTNGRRRRRCASQQPENHPRPSQVMVHAGHRLRRRLNGGSVCCSRQSSERTAATAVARTSPSMSRRKSARHPLATTSDPGHEGRPRQICFHQRLILARKFHQSERAAHSSEKGNEHAFSRVEVLAARELTDEKCTSRGPGGWGLSTILYPLHLRHQRGTSLATAGRGRAREPPTGHCWHARGLIQDQVEPCLSLKPKSMRAAVN